MKTGKSVQIKTAQYTGKKDLDRLSNEYAYAKDSKSFDESKGNKTKTSRLMIFAEFVTINSP